MAFGLVKDATASQVKSSAKFETLIGFGTSALIFNSVVQNVLNGTEVPGSHIVLVFGLILSFFINRGINIVNHLSEMESKNRAAKIEADIQLKKLDLEIQKLKLQGLEPSMPLPPSGPMPAV